MLKQSIFFALVLTAFSSCNKYVQVVSTAPVDNTIKAENNTYYYENDDVRVTYDFWAHQGQMSFSIFNKTDKPIYIDWNKSSFVSGNTKYSYFHNSETSKLVVASKGRSLQAAVPDYNAVAGVSTSISAGAGTTVKEERVTFIPPHASVTRHSYNLTNALYIPTRDKKTEPFLFNDAKVYVTYPTEKVEFRNFLSYSYKEDFSSEKYIDNGFSIPKVLSIPEEYASKFPRANRFYLRDVSWSKIKMKFRSDDYKGLRREVFETL